ncbi:hypothetical protein PMAYCL1PPCAC_25878, partial [Pristionchus mayeri]
MDDRDRSRSPMAPLAAPVIVSNSNAEEMDGTESFGASVDRRSSERRQVRPGSGRRAEVGVIGQRVQPRPMQQHLLQQSAALQDPASSPSPPPPLSSASGVEVSRAEWYEYSIARSTTIATLNAGVALARALTAFVAAAPNAPDAPLADASSAPDRALGRPALARTDMAHHRPHPHASVREDLRQQQPPAAPAAAAASITSLRRPRMQQGGMGSTPEPLITTIARTRIVASERLRAIAASLNERPPTRTTVPLEARNEGVARIRAAISRLSDPMEREEARRMLERILTPGSLHSVRSLYERLPQWEEHAPPPPGWPFRLPGQRADMQRRQTENSDGGSVSRAREYSRETGRTNREWEANSAARELYEELLASTVNARAVGSIQRLPRPAPDLLPSYEMVQLRDLPALLAVQQTRMPPHHRIDDGEEQVVPTGPSMRSVHAVPLINSQARLRENAEMEQRQRFRDAPRIPDASERNRQMAVDEQARNAMDRGEMPPSETSVRYPSHRPTDTPHPGVILSTTGETNDPPVRMSPLVQNIPREQRERMERMEREQRSARQRDLTRGPVDQRRFLVGPSSSFGSMPMQSGDASYMEEDDQPGPSRPSSSHQSARTAAAAPVQEGRIVVHKLRKSTHRAPGQRKEVNGMVGVRRLIMEHKALEEKGGVERVEAAPKPEDIRKWSAVVEGAEGSQFEGGVFFFDINFPMSYPMGRGIKIICLTHIVHPHVLRSGMVDVDAVAKLCFGVNLFADMKYGGVEKSLLVAAAVVSGKLPEASAEQTKQWIEKGRLFTRRYAC